MWISDPEHRPAPLRGSVGRDTQAIQGPFFNSPPKALQSVKAVNRKRPVNLDLTQFHFPLPAITSIIHRISGVILFIAMAFLLYGLDASLASEESFNDLVALLDGFLPTLILWGILAALLYHLVAGIKHLCMDAGIGETLEGGVKGSKIVIVVSVVLILIAGVWVW